MLFSFSHYRHFFAKKGVSPLKTPLTSLLKWAISLQKRGFSLKWCFQCTNLHCRFITQYETVRGTVSIEVSRRALRGFLQHQTLSFPSAITKKGELISLLCSPPTLACTSSSKSHRLAVVLVNFPPVLPLSPLRNLSRLAFLLRFLMSERQTF